MLETLISSKKRIKLPLKFFLNINNKGYLHGLDEEFGENSNATRLELYRFEQVGIIINNIEGNKKYFKVNIKHSLFSSLHNIIKKYIGIHTIINQLGKVEKVYLTGEISNGVKKETETGGKKMNFLEKLCVNQLNKLPLRKGSESDKSDYKKYLKIN